MKDQHNKLFRNAQIMIEGNSIRCENNIIQLSNITQIWLGKLPKEQLPLDLILLLFSVFLLGLNYVNEIIMILAVIAGAIIITYRNTIHRNSSGLNLMIASGEVYSFVSENADFMQQVFCLFNEVIGKEIEEPNYFIDFEGEGKIEGDFQAIDENIVTEEISTNEISIAKDQMTIELEVLYANYQEKEDFDEEVLFMIGQIAQLIQENNMQGIKESYSKIIRLGLINDCNKLGLSLLIEEIRKCIY